jgi:hypothetical protein
MRTIFSSIILLLLMGCASDNSKPGSDSAYPNTNSPSGSTKFGKQLNITILLDLSDRISPVTSPDIPEHYQRDTAIIKSFADLFIRDMAKRGTFMSKGKLKVIFSPQPQDPNINILASKLNVDLSKMDNKQKKEIYDNISKSFPEDAFQIYNSTIKSSKWLGSDIWRFFKDDVKDFSIDRDTNYRNILVILTDGYIYHANSMDKVNNRYAYISPLLLTQSNLHNNQNWENYIDENDFGLIAKRSDLQNLEVLVLEVSPSPSFVNDADIIKKVISKWFDEMKVKRFAIYKSELPEYTKQRIRDFIN